MKKLVAVAVVAAALGSGLLTATSASAAPELCEVSVYIDKYPAVYTGNPVGVETGEYRPYTNCV
jgi:hypothetical protein